MARLLNFTAEILSADKGAAYIEIPFDLAKEFGSKRPKIKATFNGEPYRGTAVKMGTECFVLLVRKDVRAKIGKDVGAKVKVVLEMDTEERMVEIPDVLARALKKNKTARAAFDAASYTTRKEFARAVDEAKTEETRARRIAHIIEQLQARALVSSGELPTELESALKKSKKARAVFDTMPPSHRKQYVGYILEAKQAATRQKRAEQTIEKIVAWAAARKAGS